MEPFLQQLTADFLENFAWIFACLREGVLMCRIGTILSRRLNWPVR